MTKAEVKKNIIIIKKSCFYEVSYLDINCGTYSTSYKISEIKEDVYNELKERDLL